MLRRQGWPPVEELRPGIPRRNPRNFWSLEWSSKPDSNRRSSAWERFSTEALARASSCREAARRLKVSTATVYKDCARGEASCVRVVNVLRIPRAGFRGGAGVERPDESTARLRGSAWYGPSGAGPGLRERPPLSTSGRASGRASVRTGSRRTPREGSGPGALDHRGAEACAMEASRGPRRALGGPAGWKAYRSMPLPLLRRDRREGRREAARVERDQHEAVAP
jgi:hypothetical protein